MTAELLRDATQTTLASFQLAPLPKPADRVVFFLHGFTQNSHCWGPLPDLMDQRLHAIDNVAAPSQTLLIGLDCPGHGRSNQHGTATLDESAQLIAATVRTTLELFADHFPSPPSIALLGYSMGGRLALHTLISGALEVDTLIAISTTQGSPDPEEQLNRRHEDRIRAEHLLDIGLAAFLDKWLALPLFEKIPSEHTYREERLMNDPAALARSLMFQGAGNMIPNPGRLAALQCNALFVSGAEDAKFVHAAQELTTVVGRTATHVSLPGAGHSPHLEQPEETAVVVSDFLNRLHKSGEDISR